MREPEIPDYYHMLGIREDASDKEIHKAYRSQALTVHPDHGGSVEAMQQVRIRP